MPICNYVLAYNKLQLPWLEVEFKVSEISTDLDLFFPLWRPGRYEEGNFMKNVRGMRFIVDGTKFTPERVSLNHWRISGCEGKTLQVKYQFFAKDLNAGSTHCGEDLFYVNPVNACIYAEQLKLDPQHVQLDYPQRWDIAGGLPKSDNKFEFTFDSIDHFFDTPFYASSSLKSYQFDLKGVDVNIHMVGHVEPDFLRMRKDFVGFMAAQMNDMGGFPAKEYHYLYIISENKAYHGVEHLNSTVIMLGPSAELFGEGYESLLGVSSHEVYHSWCVKTIRPTEWVPYEFNKVCPSKLGYIAEGITTLMGDLYLLKGNVYDRTWFGNEMGNHFTRYIQNFGRFRMSVADSSYETWIDGYEKGIPDRKVSIYNEGAILAFIVDYLMRLNSKNQLGLVDLMKEMYEDERILKNGISEDDWKNYLIKYIPKEGETLFNDFYNGTADYRYYAYEAMFYNGYQVEEVPAKDFCEAYLGFRVKKVGANYQVLSVYETSYASEFGISEGDVLLTVDGEEVNDEVLAKMHDKHRDEIHFHFKHEFGERKLMMRANDRVFFKEAKVELLTMDIKQRQAFNKLIGRN
jgi:predicted metalloprotease with PDZ domain